MSPFLQAATLYESCDFGSTLEEDLEFHCLHGYVINTPSCFMLARAVRRDSAPYAPRDFSRIEDADTWLVWCMAGDIREAMEFAPVVPSIKWVAFARNSVLVFHPFAKIRARIVGAHSLPHVPKRILPRLA